MQPVSLSQDRTISVPPGAVVKTGYVDVFKVRLSCRERMAVGDVDRAFQRRLQAAPNQPYPSPLGQWDGDIFVIQDGRHEWVAAVMLGQSHLLVAWMEER